MGAGHYAGDYEEYEDERDQLQNTGPRGYAGGGYGSASPAAAGAVDDDALCGRPGFFSLLSVCFSNLFFVLFCSPLLSPLSSLLSPLLSSPLLSSPLLPTYLPTYLATYLPTYLPTYIPT